MKQQVQQPAPISRTLQGKAKASSQASVSDVLQAYKKDISQRQEIEDDDELLQGKFETTQRDELEDDELLQGKFETAQRDELDDDELLQGKFETAQRDELEDDELLQGKFETTQRDELEDDELLQGKFETTQRKEAPNNTGLPDNLKAGVEQLSGLDMSDVKVHYNSSKPASVQAYAYTQGTDINVAPGQEKHLGHEAWHVAQQKQGRVQPTTTVGGMAVNDNIGLENEADVMGGKAVQMKLDQNISSAGDSSVAQKKANEMQGFGFVDNKRHERILQRVLYNPDTDQGVEWNALRANLENLLEVNNIEDARRISIIEFLNRSEDDWFGTDNQLENVVRFNALITIRYHIDHVQDYIMEFNLNIENYLYDQDVNLTQNEKDWVLNNRNNQFVGAGEQVGQFAEVHHVTHAGGAGNSIWWIVVEGRMKVVACGRHTGNDNNSYAFQTKAGGFPRTYNRI